MKPHRTLISKNSMPALFQRIEGYSSRPIDGKILAGILKMAYHCALKRGEILDLTVNDVTVRGGRQIAPKIKTKRENVPVSAQAKTFLKAHLKYLQDKGYRLSTASPLFPAPIKKTISPGAQQRGQTEKYDPRKLGFHLRKATTGIKGWSNLEGIRQAGICDFYDKELSKGTPPDEAFKATMGFARCETEEFIRGILASPRKNIQIKAPPTKLQRMFSGLSEIGISDDQRIKRAKRFCRAVDRDKKIDPGRKEDIEKRLIKALASKGITFDPSSTAP
jgi:hypothetical protein